jgi:hypothetical protein
MTGQRQGGKELCDSVQSELLRHVMWLWITTRPPMGSIRVRDPVRVALRGDPALARAPLTSRGHSSLPSASSISTQNANTFQHDLDYGLVGRAWNCEMTSTRASLLFRITPNPKDERTASKTRGWVIAHLCAACPPLRTACKARKILPPWGDTDTHGIQL